MKSHNYGTRPLSSPVIVETEIQMWNFNPHPMTLNPEHRLCLQPSVFPHDCLTHTEHAHFSSQYPHSTHPPDPIQILPSLLISLSSPFSGPLSKSSTGL